MAEIEEEEVETAESQTDLVRDRATVVVPLLIRLQLLDLAMTTAFASLL